MEAARESFLASHPISRDGFWNVLAFCARAAPWKRIHCNHYLAGHGILRDLGSRLHGGLPHEEREWSICPADLCRIFEGRTGLVEYDYMGFDGRNDRFGGRVAEEQHRHGQDYCRNR